MKKITAEQIMIGLTFGFALMLGLNIGLSQVCKSKDKFIELQQDYNIDKIIDNYEYGKKLEKEGKEIIPKNLPLITLK